MDQKRTKITYENAADRMSYVGEVFSIGEKKYKKDLLRILPKEWRDLHLNGDIHIHDLDAYGLTYNCLAFDISTFFPYEKYSDYSNNGKVIVVFDFIKEFITKLGNEQSGGMGFANFDNDLANVFTKLKLEKDNIDEDILKTCIKSFILWCNDTHERMGKVSYYITLNIGLANNDLARRICYIVLDEFSRTNSKVYKPNIIFKVNSICNSKRETVNYYLYQKALTVTTKKMIPTYVLCDSKPNKNVDPNKLVIMGCRTRVIDDKYGEIGSIGRGNIANISINLPRIALKLHSNGTNSVIQYLNEWDKVALVTSKILEHRFHMLVNNRSNSDFKLNSTYNLWVKSFKDYDLNEIFMHGTLSLGFIGLSETIEILTGNKFYENEEAYKIAKILVTHMKKFIDGLRDNSMYNYSLLGTSGELISGRFTTLDIKTGYNHSVLEKEFYTNSFHVEVDSKINTYKKIELEGPFHELCNGGCITYLELKEAPLNNEVALEDLLQYAMESGIHYMGFNFDLDICDECGEKGIFDSCPNCKCENIIRIRRVSGYLEVFDYFTKGKQKEVEKRKENEVKLCIYQ